jgi:hypothetical protein
LYSHKPSRIERPGVWALASNSARVARTAVTPPAAPADLVSQHCDPIGLAVDHAPFKLVNDLFNKRDNDGRRGSGRCELDATSANSMKPDGGADFGFSAAGI